VRPVGTGQRFEVVAHNTATASSNKIHDDEVARRYGFGGGLVPGVDVYAYMTRPAAAAWGLDWLTGGTIQVRFLSPVYEGQAVVVIAGEPAPATVTATATDGPGPTMAIELRNADGTVCATGEAGLPGADDGPGPGPGPGADRPPPPLSTWPDVAPAPAADPPDASPESLAPGTALRMAGHRFHADQADAYLADVREELPLYQDARVAHPGWLLRDANHVLSANVRLGPWIHVESRVRHHSLVRDGESIDARAVVTREWTPKGHRFVELDVGIVADGERLVARVDHTAIYRPREPSRS
jgi:acyl dehydratase